MRADLAALRGYRDIATEWIPLPDGTRLAARLFLPDGAEDTPVPAVVEALPYRRRDVTAARDESVYPGFAALGIAGVRIDLRGTGDSGGALDDEYSETELGDIEAAIAWIADQPWCSGKIGMMGISWGGFNALQVAARRPPALKAVISIASTVDRFADDIHYKGGAHLSANLYWATQMLGRAAHPPDEAVVGPDWRRIWQDRLEALRPLILRWLRHQRRDAYWRHGSICEDFAAVEAKALVIAGWADGYRNTPWKARAGLGEKARAISGPWVHLYPHFATPRPRLDFLGEAGRWWGKWLLDIETGVEDLPAHRLWLSEAVRPGGPRDVEPGRWIAIDQAEAASGTVLHLGHGTLTTTATGNGGKIAIRTPLDCGMDGGAFFTQGGTADLPGDQHADDGLSTCFETPVLTEALDIIGAPVVRLPVTLDAPQGNLIARLVDVHPDGPAHRISLGVLNLSHRNGSETPAPMVPGQSEIITLTLDVTAYRLRPGHRLRLALSTAYFPLVLPPPTDVTASIRLGTDATLHLPTQAYDLIDLPEPELKLPIYPRASAARETRYVTRRGEIGCTTVSVEGSTGELRHPEHGLCWCADRQSTWSIARQDPLSLKGMETYSAAHRRNGVKTEITATGTLSVTETDWVVAAEISAREQGKAVFHRTWSDRIPRDHM